MMMTGIAEKLDSGRKINGKWSRGRRQMGESWGGGVRYARTLVRIVRGMLLTRLAAVQLDWRGGSEG